MKWPRGARTARTEGPKDRDLLREAFVAHEQLGRPMIEALGTSVTPYIAGERWKNFQKYAKDHPAIAEIVSVRVSTTSDTGEHVFTLRSVDGREVSFWCVADSGNSNSHRVKSVTNY